MVMAYDSSGSMRAYSNAGLGDVDTYLVVRYYFRPNWNWDGTDDWSVDDSFLGTETDLVRVDVQDDQMNRLDTSVTDYTLDFYDFSETTENKDFLDIENDINMTDVWISDNSGNPAWGNLGSQVQGHAVGRFDDTERAAGKTPQNAVINDDWRFHVVEQDPGSQLDELLRLLQEFHNLAQLLFGLGDPGDVVERHRGFIACKHAGAALPERQCLAIAALGLSHQEIEKCSNENQGQYTAQDGQPASPVTGLLYGDTGLHNLLWGDTQVHESLYHIRGALFMCNRRLSAVFVVDLDLFPGDHHFFDLAIVDLEAPVCETPVDVDSLIFSVGHRPGKLRALTQRWLALGDPLKLPRDPLAGRQEGSS